MRLLVVHAPPFFHVSAGIRALYALALRVQDLGHPVAVRHDWQTDRDPATWCPFPLRTITPESPEFAGALHVVPEIMPRHALTGLDVVWWQLSEKWRDRRSEDRVWVWAPKSDRDPRLMVEVIERDLFTPKTQPGSGVLWFAGKGRADSGWVPRGAQQIRRSWPTTRQATAEALRGAELLVSFDRFSVLNLEATLCGTPVLLPESCGPVHSLMPLLGIARNHEGLERARAELSKVPAAYEAMCAEIADDVPRFLAEVA